MGELIWGIVIVICRTIQSRNVLCKRLRDCACPWLKRLAASASIRDLRRAVIDVAVSLCLIQQHRKGLCRDCTEESSSSESAAVKIMSWVYTAQVTRIQHRLQDCMHEFIKNVCFFFFFFAATQCYALHSTRIVALTWMDIITSWDPHKVLDSRDIRSWFAQLTIAPVTQSECILILSLPLCLSPPQWDRERSARRHC